MDKPARRSFFSLPAICAALSLSALALAGSPARASAPGVVLAPATLRAEEVRQAQVVVVSGSADHMEQVLRKAGAKFVVVSAAEIANLPLHSQQVLMVNCRGDLPAPARERVRRFVAAGGFLYTTDHAVHELIEPTFPGTIAWNHVTTQQLVFPLQVYGDKSARGLLKHLGGSAAQRWQLAGGGYLFKVLDPHRVETLMESKEVAARYGTGVLGVRFKYEDGYVIHVTGHFYTQPGQDDAVAGAGRAFEQLSANVVTEKAADKERLDSLYSAAPREQVTLQFAPDPAAPPVAAASVTTQTLQRAAKVRVLDKKGAYFKVRDEQGNEGWAPSAAF
jgi:hypothetical protein